MSNHETEVFLENLYSVIAELEPHLNKGELETFQRLVDQNDLEAAKDFVDSLEARHADDLR